MPIKTNLTTLAPARERFKKEIQLISHGYSMKETIPDGKLTVYPWDQTVDDWVLKNIKRINVQTLPFELVKQVTGLKNVDQLPTGDVNTILLVAKSASRGSLVSYTATCPSCASKEEVSLKVPDELEKIGEKTNDYPGYDDVTLPAAKDVLRVRPLLVRDEKALIERPENDPIPRRIARAVSHLVSVNDGVPDSVDEAVTYFRALQPSDFDFLFEQLNLLDPHLGTDVKHQCDQCGTKYTHALMLDGEFFR